MICHIRHCVALALVSTLVTPATAQQIGFTDVGGEFEMATDIQRAPGDAALYVAELIGDIHVLEGGTVRSQPLLDIRDRVAWIGELGLLGLVFDPQWPSSPYVYVHYGAPNPGGATQYRQVISRFTADPSTRVADPGSEVLLFTSDQPNGWHAAGSIAFGNDGYLYVTLGESGVPDQAQSLSSTLGTIVRLDVRGGGGPLDCATSGTATVPAGNPFVDGPGGMCDEIFAYGFRNPWRLSIDPATGTIWVGDVGDAEWEEIDVVQAGANYGWPIMEGAHCHFNDPSCSQAGLTLPVWEYARAPGNAIVGGYVYRGSNIPTLTGRYLFGDLSTGNIWALRDTGSGMTADLVGQNPGGQLLSFGVGDNGEMYVSSTFGPIRRIESGTVATPAIPERGGAEMVVVGPNPFADRTVLRVAVGTTGSARVVLVDALGRTVATIFDGALEAGVPVDVPVHGSELAPGAYVAQMASDDGVRSLRLTIVR